MENVIIDINDDSTNPCFIIKGRYNDIVSNKRLQLTLRRLNYYAGDKIISIPFRVENQIQVLQEIQNFLLKYELTYSLSN